ncbi:2-amino-4-hydroxy-6-hydroxymethyldihydropteridine diphosphokinase [Flexithrix dorotheae]|uniref:2-amino-4-hydroxy-6- hydroxymethyldihydropteridine diphosphokinase n=1 Tax=Flexithrix dorotheae TaxID=70993 RepID=UPI00037526DF|nr:2-amino-4-hydroxy-6-hydroxymethyldihydropteridine diphosphokinase [Flexithrix dorotheae]
MATVYILLGTNLGNREENLDQAMLKIKETIGQVLQKSSVYETAAWGIEEQPAFYNQVLKVNTNLPPEVLLQKLLEIEVKMGRIRIKKWFTRLIDIDILYYDQNLLESPDLTIPHKEIQNRKFTLIPLVEIAPDYIHPGYLKTNKELLNLCEDKLEVTKVK